MQRLFIDIVSELPFEAFRQRLRAMAKVNFPHDYTGEVVGMSPVDARERYNWLRGAYISEAAKTIGDERSGFLWHALDDVFAATFPDIKPRSSRDLDASLYTVPFNETVRSFNRRLVDRLVQRAKELASQAIAVRT